MTQAMKVEMSAKLPVRLEWIAPASDLSDLVHTFYVIEAGSGKINEPLPAYSAQLVVFARGEGVIEYANGEIAATQTVFVNAPQLEAGQVQMDGPLFALGASLTPLGWAALSGMHADEVHDCPVPVEAIVEAETVEALSEWAASVPSPKAEPRDAIAVLEAAMRSAKHPIKPRHRDFVECFNAWLSSALNPPIEELYKRIPLSRRQAQRLSRQFFGAPPAQVLIRHRAMRTAMLLSNPDVPQPLRDEIGTAYFDQAHMIRDIRRFTGRTPAHLTQPSLANESLDPKGHGSTAERLMKGDD